MDNPFIGIIPWSTLTGLILAIRVTSIAQIDLGNVEYSFTAIILSFTLTGLILTIRVTIIAQIDLENVESPFIAIIPRSL